MRLALRLVVALCIAVGTYVALLYLLLAVGGTECDRGECNFVGELAVDDVGRWVLGVGFIALALMLGVSMARRLVR